MGELQLFRGSYGTVTIDEDKVCKVQPLYMANSSNLEYYSLVDCCMSVLSTHMACSALPVIDSIDINADKVKIHMPYYGTTLDKWMSHTKYEKKLEMLPSIIKQLVYACDALLHNDIQHTDIKPANIMIHEGNIVLIDYNIYSVKTLTGWIDSVGTWCYVSPEILIDGCPCDTSMSWSIGVIIAECLAGYPLGPIHKCVQNVQSHKDWRDLILRLKHKFKDGLPMTQHHNQNMPEQYIKLVNKCTLWNNHARYSLSEILKHCSIEPNECKMLCFPVTPFLSDRREEIIDRITSLCTSRPYLHNLLYRSIWLYDLFASNDTMVVITCICISYIFIGYTLNPRMIKCLSQTFELDLDLHDVQQKVLHHLQEAKWKVHDKSADVLALNMGIPMKSVLLFLPKVMKTLTTSYDGFDIAHRICKEYVHSCMTTV
jgi:serine/threonine protein kinase